MQSYDLLIREAERAHFSGWDFSWLQGRHMETAPMWDYRSMVMEYLPDSKILLDIGTGDGEFLMGLTKRPEKTFATENYPPNITIAEKNLSPLGIQIVQLGENDEIPFEDELFDLIINRHSSINMSELYRVLKPGSFFATQQVGAFNHLQLNQFLAPDIAPIYSSRQYQFDTIYSEFLSNGFKVLRAESAGTPAFFNDIGAVVYYLRVIEWQIDGFTIERYEEQLRLLDDRIRAGGRFECVCERYLFVVQKPDENL